MKSLKTIKNLLKEKKQFLEKRYNIKVIGIFGSCAREKHRNGSDVDILVEFSISPDFFEFLRLEEFLRGVLGMKVDLVTRDALKSIIKKEVLKETIYI